MHRNKRTNRDPARVERVRLAAALGKNARSRARASRGVSVHSEVGSAVEDRNCCGYQNTSDIPDEVSDLTGVSSLTGATLYVRMNNAARQGLARTGQEVVAEAVS